ncbi:hypothetical protein CDD82_483 [Ophiocordyceps australis]|uniref:FAD dependent oxidoreductase domain-containing protein n=1 Tax=Ophiocordyceps australis TaxID=1399860 RepID=A0A2C5ZQ55_9HYPO|nr:hypothetical protein CDD82_483 [Ophiocordyceps australis]
MTRLGLDAGDGASLPSESSTASFWHQAAQDSGLLGHRTTAALPTRANVVVVGSGIAGAFVAREVLELVGEKAGVVMLEAREACWGATGRVSLDAFTSHAYHDYHDYQDYFPPLSYRAAYRWLQNAGRCQPDIWNNGATPHIARFELATYSMLSELVRREAIDCSWQEVGDAHVLLSDDEAVAAREKVARLPGELRALVKLEWRGDGERQGESSRIRGEAVGVVVQEHGARCWPYKLVAWVLRRMLQGGETRFNLQTGTPVTRLVRVSRREEARGGQGDDEARWMVHTPRGQVAARHVVLATNAYTSHLLPQMSRLIVPVRGQVCALRPPRRAVLLPHDYTWLSHGADDYLIQRAADQEGNNDDDAGANEAGGFIIVGGERFVVAGGQEGISADDVVEPRIGAALRTAVPQVLELQEAGEARASRLEAAWEWTGIMGYSRDARPWVGRVPGQLVRGGGEAEHQEAHDDDDDGLWICAGFTGHGMPVAPGCGVAVARMLVGKAGDGVSLPPEYVACAERLGVAAARAELPRGAWDC